MNQEPSVALKDTPLAHLDESGRPHPLIKHLESVAALAGQFAARFGAGEWAALAGRWHDLGKYAEDFQRRILQANGFAAHLEAPTGERDHSSAGALYAWKALQRQALPIAFAIAGHHAGLADFEKLMERLQKKEERLAAALAGGPPADLLAVPSLTLPAVWTGAVTPAAQRRSEMWTRLVFSALCDADFLDTEAFYNGERAALRRGGADLDTLAARLGAYLDRLQAEAPPSEVNRVRAEVLAACRAAAGERPGCFSLTVPTGGGKTLAAMAFALDHARRQGLHRVVVAIPYTSIIEQNAEVYCAALGGENVIEHHSALDPTHETPRNRIASENWDAPVVVTTTVQLLESLFARRPGACRKLHRLAGSVIVLDEAQTLPPGLLAPILDGLGTLVEVFGATLVLSTATQPALGRSPRLPDGLADIREIVPAELRTFERLRRVRVRWPAPLEPMTYAALAEEVARESDVLAIVHKRRDARELCQLVDERLGEPSTLHLSALMCAEHRSRVLATIREHKRRGEPLRLVATQLVEAGVDLDFPVVYRALGGLDALAQAAGRCNREGRLAVGELRVFVAPTAPPPGVLDTAAGVARALLAQDPALDLFSPAVYRRYFQQLYGARRLDEKEIQEARSRLRYEQVAQHFRMVEDDWSAPLVVPYGEAQRYLDELGQLGPSRERLRALQRYTVNVPRRLHDEWLAGGEAYTVADTVTALAGHLRAAYDERFGLVPARVGQADPRALIVDG